MIGFFNKRNRDNYFKNEKAYLFLKDASNSLVPDSNIHIVCDIVRDIVRAGYIEDATKLNEFVKTDEDNKQFKESILEGEAYSMPTTEYINKLDKNNSTGWFYLLQRLIQQGNTDYAISLFKEKTFWKPHEDSDRLLRIIGRFTNETESVIEFIQSSNFKDKTVVLKWIRENLISKQTEFQFIESLLKAVNFYNDRSKSLMMFDLLFNGQEQIAKELHSSISIDEYYDSSLFEFLKYFISQGDYDTFKKYSLNARSNNKATKRQINLIDVSYWIKEKNYSKIELSSFSENSSHELVWSCVRYQNWEYAEQVIDFFNVKKDEYYGILSLKQSENNEFDLAIKTAQKIKIKGEREFALASLIKVIAEKGHVKKAEDLVSYLVKQAENIYYSLKSIGIEYIKLDNLDNASRVLKLIPDGHLRAQALDDAARYILGFDPWTKE